MVKLALLFTDLLVVTTISYALSRRFCRWQSQRLKQALLPTEYTDFIVVKIITYLEWKPSPLARSTFVPTKYTDLPAVKAPTVVKIIPGTGGLRTGKVNRTHSLQTTLISSS